MVTREEANKALERIKAVERFVKQADKDHGTKAPKDPVIWPIIAEVYWRIQELHASLNVFDCKASVKCAEKHRLDTIKMLHKK